jgi:uncharacterized protein YkwD
MKTESRGCEVAWKYRDYSRRVLRAASIAAVLFLSASPLGAQTSTSFTEQVENRVLALVNQFRSAHSLAPLKTEQRLDEAARHFASYLATAGKLGHEADGTTAAARASQHGYDYCVLAENLAYEYHSGGFSVERLAQNLVEGWKNSPSHRANMLERDVTQTGLNIVRTRKNGEFYAVQMFGRPASAKVKFRVENRARSTIRYAYNNRSFSLGPLQMRSHESCVAGNLKIDSPGPRQDTTLQPRDGTRYTIVDAGRNALSVVEE